MIDNPIVEEIHQIREQMLAEYDGDLDALLKDAQRRTEAAAREGRRVVTLPSRPVEQPAPATKKVG